MTKDQVFEVVRTNIVDLLDDVVAAQVDRRKSMKELGANSLDIVEIVTCCMRDLRVKVPRSELNTLQNIGDLVDLLHQVAQQADEVGE
jgi:acyl carrier protein